MVQLTPNVPLQGRLVPNLSKALYESIDPLALWDFNVGAGRCLALPTGTISIVIRTECPLSGFQSLRGVFGPNNIKEVSF